MHESETPAFDGGRGGHRRSLRASQERLFTVREVASILNMSDRSIRRWIDEEKLTHHKFGRAVRISESDLRTFMAAHRSI